MLEQLALPVAQSGPVIPTFQRGSSCVRENRQFCWDWFSSHWSSTFQPRLIEHIELTADRGRASGSSSRSSPRSSPTAGTGPSIRRRRSSRCVYTIPSLAFFQLMVPFTGLTRLSAEIALVSYTLLILFRNILTGLREVPPDALEAAQAMGLTRRQTLLRVELPLAMPAIMAGIRIATVTIISLATVAAFIGVGGLGEPIFNAHPDRLQDAVHRRRGAGRAAGAGHRCGCSSLVQRLLTPWARAKVRLSMHSIIDAFQFIGDNLHFMLTKTLEHLALSGAAIAVSLVIAIPLGVTLGHLHRGSFLAINASNIGRALPSLAIISIGIGILGIGFINVMVAMVVLAVPPMLTNAYVAVDGVDPDAVEAARAVGMSPSQVLWKVEIPLAHAADVRRHPDRRGVRRRDRYARRDRRGRRPRRRHRQPGELRDRRA